jgi:uroporphyrinogen III methyltransferase/synthase
MARRSGIVYIVGAGPGDVGLITVRGAECLAQSDVVVYDNLANELLLDHAPRYAERIFVGKEASQHSKSQDEINYLLVEKARAGLAVTRLKGGDPFLFGRGGEEAAYLAQHGIDFEAVPGVTSALAVPAYAGIPVTHRSVNGSLHIVTGHENVQGVGPDIDWGVVAQARGTVVFLMGVGNLASIVARLKAANLTGKTPIALIRWGTMPEQQTLISTLDDVVEEVRRQAFGAPAVGVIGEVVRLREEIAWAERRPLFGIRAAVTRPEGQGESLAKELRQMGAEVVTTPTIRIREASFDEVARTEINELARGTYQWVIFTSATAVRTFGQWLFKAGLDVRALAKSRVAAIGDRTADALQELGIRADLVPAQSRQEGLVGAMQTHPGERVLIPRASSARDVLEKELAARAVDVKVLPLYDTRPDRDGIARLRKLLTRGRVHLVTFTSASTFEKLAEGIKAEDLPKLFAEVTVASIGPATSEAIRSAGVTVHLEAKNASTEELSDAIRSWFVDMKGERTRTR